MPVEAAAAEIPALLNVTEISGSRSGYTEVRLTKPLRALDEDAPEIKFEDGGEVVGVVLRPEPDAMGNASPVFTAYSLGGTGQFRGFSGHVDHDGTLPPGTYRLYLIAEQPGSATIEFAGLDPGELSVAPRVETPQRSGAIATQSSGHIVKFSERVSLWGGGVIFLKVFPTMGVGTELELCSYWPDQEAEAGEHAYDRGCPYGHSNYRTPILSEGEGAFTFSSPSHQWAQGLGGNVTDAIGPPGPVDTYLFSAGYDLGPPPAWTQTPDPTRDPEEDEPVPVTPPEGPTGAAPPTAGPTTSEPTPKQERPQSPPPPENTEPTGCRRTTCTGGWDAATLASARALLRGRRARIAIRCAASRPCRGKAGFVRGRTRRFSLPVGAEATLRVVVPRRIRRRVARKGRARVRVVVTSRLSGETVQVYRRVRLERNR